MLLTRSPLEYPRRGLSVRLACVKHAASVRPEPGSNSPQKISPKRPTRLREKPNQNWQKNKQPTKNNPLIIHQKNNEKSKAKNSDHRCLDETTQQPPNTHTLCDYCLFTWNPTPQPTQGHKHETHTMFRINNSFPWHNIFTSKPHLPAKTVYTVIIT